MKNDSVEQELLKARVKLLLIQPLIGQVMMHLHIEDASDWCSTAATNGKTLFYNHDFVQQLSTDNLIFVVAHEVLHVVLDHVYRRGHRDKMLWNMAIDFITNYALVQSKIGKMPEMALYDERYTDDYSAEELYTLLEQSSPEIKLPLDMHLDSCDVSKESDGQSGPPMLTAAEIDDMRDQVRTTLLQAQQNTPAGKLPVGVKRLLDRLMTPKLNWRQILYTLMRSMIKYDYTYMRPSRRSYSSGLILPGQETQERVTATAFLDGSASTSKKMVSDFLAECRSIMTTFRDYELTIATFDTEIYNVKVFTPFNMHEINAYEFKGGGGTLPSCCWKYLKEKRLKPDKILLFTDGEVNLDWGDSNYADTVFIIHSNPDIIAPYGRTIHYQP